MKKKLYKNSSNYSSDLKNEIKKRKKLYIASTDKKILNQSKFLKTLTTINHNTGECYNLVYAPEKIFAEDYFYFKQASFLLNKEQLENDKIAVFYTATLKSEYHIKAKNDLNPNAFLKDAEGYIKDKNNNLIEKKTVEEGYKVLNDHNRQIYKSFKIKNKPIKIKYIAVFENHGDFTPHLHAIYYIPKEYLTQFKTFLYRLNKNNKELGNQREIKVIGEVIRKVNKEKKAINNAVKYLLKYVEKTFNNFDKTFYGWKTYNKIRFFRVSKVGTINKTIYKKISKQMKLSVNNDNIDYIGELYGVSKPYNTLDLYNKICNFKITTEDEKTKDRKVEEIKKAENAHAYIEIIKTRKTNKKRELNKNSFNSNYKNLLKTLNLYLSIINLTTEKENYLFNEVKTFINKENLTDIFINYLENLKKESLEKLKINQEKNQIRKLQAKEEIKNINLALNTLKVNFQEYEKNCYLSTKIFLDYFYLFLESLLFKEIKTYSYIYEEFIIIDLKDNNKIHYDKKMFETIFDFTKEKD